MVHSFACLQRWRNDRDSVYECTWKMAISVATALKHFLRLVRHRYSRTIRKCSFEDCFVPRKWKFKKILEVISDIVEKSKKAFRKSGKKISQSACRSYLCTHVCTYGDPTRSCATPSIIFLTVFGHRRWTCVIFCNTRHRPNPFFFLFFSPFHHAFTLILYDIASSAFSPIQF